MDLEIFKLVEEGFCFFDLILSEVEKDLLSCVCEECCVDLEDEEMVFVVGGGEEIIYIKVVYSWELFLKFFYVVLMVEFKIVLYLFLFFNLVYVILIIKVNFFFLVCCLKV